MYKCLCKYYITFLTIFPTDYQLTPETGSNWQTVRASNEKNFILRITFILMNTTSVTLFTLLTGTISLHIVLKLPFRNAILRSLRSYLREVSSVRQ